MLNSPVVLAVSENYFQVLGVSALRGRTFESMGVPELVASPSVLISENYWRKRFAGDPAILGQSHPSEWHGGYNRRNYTARLRRYGNRRS